MAVFGKKKRGVPLRKKALPSSKKEIEKRRGGSCPRERERKEPKPPEGGRMSPQGGEKENFHEPRKPRFSHREEKLFYNEEEREHRSRGAIEEGDCSSRNGGRKQTPALSGTQKKKREGGCQKKKSPRGGLDRFSQKKKLQGEKGRIFEGEKISSGQEPFPGGITHCPEELAPPEKKDNQKTKRVKGTPISHHSPAKKKKTPSSKGEPAAKASSKSIFLQRKGSTITFPKNREKNHYILTRGGGEKVEKRIRLEERQAH